MSLDNVKLTLNLEKVAAQIKEKSAKGLVPLTTQIHKDCNYYAPKRTDTLISKSYIDFNSGATEDLAILKWGVPHIVPYAAYVYKGVSKSGNPLKYSHDRNPNAQKEWIKKAKSVKLMEWNKAAEKLLKGINNV